MKTISKKRISQPADVCWTSMPTAHYLGKYFSKYRQKKGISFFGFLESEC